MDAAFEFLTAPATGTRVLGVIWDGGTGFAPDAEIAAVVLRQIFDLVLGGELPNLGPSPRGKRADFGQAFTGRELVQLGLLKIFTRRRLLAAKSSEPEFVRSKGFQQRIDFSELAALRRLRLIKDSKS